MATNNKEYRTYLTRRMPVELHLRLTMIAKRRRMTLETVINEALAIGAAELEHRGSSEAQEVQR